jgi:hypothetical protein
MQSETHQAADRHEFPPADTRPPDSTLTSSRLPNSNPRWVWLIIRLGTLTDMSEKGLDVLNRVIFFCSHRVVADPLDGELS